ncbi:MAG TPA: DUF2304 domain-containing protein [Kofleriaceae bacterium]|jgi:hypothetical protein
MLIRIILIGAMAATGWFVFRRRHRLPIHIMLVFGLLTVGALAVIFPLATTDVAHFLGVGRGTDLITYIAIVTVMFVLVHYYTKFVELQTQVTQLTRELAILRAEVDRVAPPEKAPADETAAS